MKTLAIVCARAGSKRRPGKHWIKINDQPIWQIAVEACEKARATLSVLSTDDEKMLGSLKSKCYGIKRPKELADPKASIHWALVHALERMAEQYPFLEFETVLCVPANVPTVSAEIINRCIQALEANKRATAAMTMRKVTEPVEWQWTAKNKYVERENKNAAYRMQDLPERWIATGTCVAVRTKTLKACRSNAAFEWLGKQIVPVEDPFAIEIHEERDARLAKILLEEGRKL